MAKKINMIGFKSGKLTVIAEGPSTDDGIYWICQCECGKQITTRGSRLRGKRPPQSCGCERTKKLIEYNQTNNIKDLTNQIFGFLTVLEPTDMRSSNKSVIWKCRCRCGKEVFVSSADLCHHNTKSCGCSRYKSFGEDKIKKILNENNISFIQEYCFNDLYFEDTGYQARFDFYVNDKYIIEYDGRQHFIQGNGVYDNKEKFMKTQEHDRIKNEYCFQHGIPIIRIPYTELDNLTIEMLQVETSKFLLREPGSAIG